MRIGGIARANLDANYSAVQLDLQKVGEETGANVIRPIDSLCNATQCPSVDVNGEPIYKDNAHLRPKYVRKKAHFIDEVLL